MTEVKTETAQRPTVLLAGTPEQRQALVSALGAEYEILVGDDVDTTLMLLDEIAEINLVVIAFDTGAAAGLLAKIRAAKSVLVRQKPVLAAVKQDDEASQHLMLQSGATDLATFPIDPLQLLARVRSQVERDMAARASREGAAEDPLTGVASKRYFLMKGAQDAALALRHQEKLAVLRFEVDGLKASYDEHGEEFTDALLVWIAGLLKQNCRQEDTIARVGGSEFAVLAPRTDEAQAIQICERLRRALAAAPFRHGKKALAVTFSAGISVLGVDPELDIDGLLRLSTERLTLARKRGNTVAGSEGLITGSVAAAEQARAVAEPAARAKTIDTRATLTVDQALALLGGHEEERVSPEIAKLLLQLVPLLQLGNRELNLGLGFAISAMEKRLQMILEDQALAGE